MANKHATGTHSTVIRCPNCGEDYSITYKRCPFCDEKTVPPSRRRGGEEEYGDDLPEEEYDDDARPGGKRLAGSAPSRGGGRRGGGGGSDWTPLRVVGTVISVALIVAAVWIVVTVVMPLVGKGKVPAEPTPPATAQVTPTPPATTPAETDAPPVETGSGLVPGETLAPGTEPSAVPSQNIPATQTATGFTLNKSDFTINDAYPDPVRLKVTFTPAGTTGEITWTSSNSDVVAVDATGLVSHGSKTGSATITATMAGGYKQECTVRNSVTSGGGSASGSGGSQTSTAPSGSVSLNREDFSFSKVGETFKMKVSGTSSNPVWAIGDTSVATISGDGTVTAVGSGNTTITCTVDGQTLKCIVRCQF